MSDFSERISKLAQQISSKNKAAPMLKNIKTLLSAVASAIPTLTPTPTDTPIKLQPLIPSVLLEAGELCYYEQKNSGFVKQLKSKDKIVLGKLIFSSRKVYFIGRQDSWSLSYNKIMNIDAHFSGIYIHLEIKKGAGFYHCPNAPEVQKLLLHLVKLNKRLEVMEAGKASRHIPREVRLEVWQRDGGVCTECQASEYLEFDHIIPHSKGGASTVANIQLLCRRCNLAKSDRL